MIVATALLACCAVQQSASAPQPAAVPQKSYALDSLGMRGRPTRYSLFGGHSYSTLNFVDDTHVLLTFAETGVMPRDAAGAAHDDHVQEFEIVEVATGRVTLSREFTLHDHSAYLWPLRNGTFLLRDGDTLFVMDSRLRTSLLMQPGLPIRWVQADTAANLIAVVVEHEKHTPEEHARQKRKALLHNATEPDEVEEVLGYRIAPLGEPVFRAKIPAAAALPATDNYWLQAVPFGSTEYNLQLTSWKNPQTHEVVATLASSCTPPQKMLAADLLVAISCDGMDMRLTAIRIERGTTHAYWGHAVWHVTEKGMTTMDYVTTASHAGFAIVTLLDEELPASAPDTDSGPAVGHLQLLDVSTGLPRMVLPVWGFYGLAHTADVSPDGSTLAVLRNGALETYRIPDVPTEKTVGRKAAQAK